MRTIKAAALAVLTTVALGVSAAAAEEVGCVTTAWKLIGANHKICVDAFDDPRIPGVACHLSQARTGGLAGTFGLATDPSKFSIACRQVGPITVPPVLPENEIVFNESTSILFKETRVVRMLDKKRFSLVYLVYSTKLIDGSPMNSISTVPIMPWRQ
ncbi:MAG: CreA family protein [Rhodospirillaceae bacterium]